MLSTKLKSQIKEHALSDKLNEVCGLIVSINGENQIHKCSNISYHKTSHASLNPLDYVRAARLGKIIAHYHSHIATEKPSFIDYLNALNHNLYSIIYCIGSDKFYIIEPKLKDYLNKDFKYGESDCFSLFRNYYKNELNININDYNRDENWYKIVPNMFLSNLEKEGFYKIDYKDIKINDLIFFNINNVASHSSIYLGDNFILHHPPGEQSIISEITDAFKKRINSVWRHRDIKYE